MCEVRPGARDRSAFHPLVLGACSALLGLALLVWGPPGPDVPAHLYQIAEFRSLGFRAWDNLWYGGSYTEVGYSLIFAPLAATVGVPAVSAAAAALASAAFADIVRRRWAGHWRPAACAFALLAPTPILDGQFPFLLGAGFGIAALWALQVRRTGWAVASMLLCAAASPLALIFTLVPLAAAALSLPRWWRERRMVVAAAGIGGVVAAQLMLQLAFTQPGAQYPRGWLEAIEVGVVCGAGLVLCRGLPGYRIMRSLFWVYAVMAAAAFTIPSTIGGNFARLAAYMAVPLLLVPMAGRRFRPYPAVLPVLALALVWQGGFLVRQGLANAASPAEAQAAFWAPVTAFLTSHADRQHRVEVVATAGKWESYWLPRLGIPIARGWFRQDDWPQNAALYGPLTSASYLAWLRDMGVRYVLLADGQTDPSARPEAALLRAGRVLPQVARLPRWTVYEVPDATPIVTPASDARILALAPQELTVLVRRAGAYRLRLSYTPYWAVSGPACVAARRPWGTVMRAGAPGIVILRFQVSAEAIVDTLAGGDRCVAPGSSG